MNQRGSHAPMGCKVKSKPPPALLHQGLRKVLPDVLGPRVGARPLKRDIQARIENSVAKLILQALSFT